MKEVVLRAKYLGSGVFEYYDSSANIKNLTDELRYKDVLLTIQEFSNKRTLKQNAYYNGVVIPTIITFLKDTQGEIYGRDDIHQYNLLNIVGTNIQTKDILGDLVPVMNSKSTSQMSVKEMADFIDKTIDFWMMKTNGLLYIPPPDYDTLK